ncbi:hypothetical protein Pyrfu_0226 [Pyrolobus fumarii 1A]|uniref:Uncharacterized protein n=1 Tax=Pyrolobus fumarii (strain DSM 11204 / 1A) TaxID=694429 RepID=G0EEY4_PYRF1|nr:hypothetical protein Pyrfu_0226 [Pyrolobus fumarii 1A]
MKNLRKKRRRKKNSNIFTISQEPKTLIPYESYTQEPSCLVARQDYNPPNNDNETV